MSVESLFSQRVVSTDLGQTGKIDEGEGKDMGREDAKTDRQWRDSCVRRTAFSSSLPSFAGPRLTSVLSRLELSIGHDFLPNLVEVVKLLSWAMELSWRGEISAGTHARV